MDPEIFYRKKNNGKKVCIDCFDDFGVTEFITDNGKTKGCDYCDGKDMSHSAYDVFDYIEECINRFYGAADNEGVGFSSEEGGYHSAKTYDTYDLIEAVDLEPSTDELRADLEAHLPDQIWSKIDPHGEDLDDELKYGWQAFEKLIKYRCRFMFMKFEKSKPHYFADAQLISKILERLKELFESYGMIKKIPKGTRIVRARSFDPTKPYGLILKNLCPPPEGLPGNSRMSPAGIPMFYGARSPKTALKEIKAKHKEEVVLAEFVLQKDIHVIDLCNPPEERRSIFCGRERIDQFEINFLNNFIREFSKPIEKNAKNVDYVPTQIVTEFCKYAVRFKKEPISGFLYPSSVNKGEKCFCLFFDRHDCGVPKRKRLFQKKDTVLAMDRKSVKKTKASYIYSKPT